MPEETDPQTTTGRPLGLAAEPGSPRPAPDPRIVEALDWLYSAMTRLEKVVSNLLPDAMALATCRIYLEKAGDLISDMTVIEAVTTENALAHTRAGAKASAETTDSLPKNEL